MIHFRGLNRAPFFLFLFPAHSYSYFPAPRKEGGTMRMHNHSTQFVLACLLLVFGFAWTAPAQADITYSGRAFAAFVNVPTLGVAPQFISDTGELPPSGGFKSADLVTVGVPGVLNANLLVASTSGANRVAR